MDACIALGYQIEARVLRHTPLIPRFLMAAPGRHRFSPVLLDFQYFTDSRAVEERIEGSRHLQGLDEEMREGYGTFLSRLWHLYQHIVQLQQQLTHALMELPTLPQGSNATAALTATSLLGSILLLLDKYIPGLARERSIVAYIRLNSGVQSVASQAPGIIKLCASTGFSSLHAAKAPAGYPEQYLARCKLPSAAIKSALQSYIASVQDGSSGSAASRVYLALLFVPDLLNGDSATLKLIVAKLFRTSWVVTWAPGQSVDVALEWQRYRAARNAIGAVVTPLRAKQLTTQFSNRLPGLQTTISSHLEEIDRGLQLSDKLPQLLPAIQETHTALRWLMLHSAGPQLSKVSAAVANQNVDKAKLCKLMLDTVFLAQQLRSGHSSAVQQHSQAHCHRIAAKLTAASQVGSLLGPSGVHSNEADQQEPSQRHLQLAEALQELSVQVQQLALGTKVDLQELHLRLLQLQSDSVLLDMPSTTGDAPASDPPAQQSRDPGQRPAASELTGTPPGQEQEVSPAATPGQYDRAGLSDNPSQVPAQTSGLWDGSRAWFDAEASPRNVAGSSDSDWVGDAYQQDVLGQQSPHTPREGAASSRGDRQHSSSQTAEMTQPQAPGSNGQGRGAGSLEAIRAALAEAEHRVDQLAGLAASSAEVQASLQDSSQLGYFWGLFDSYAGNLQQQVQLSPEALPKLAALFQQMRSIMQPALSHLEAYPDADAHDEVVGHFSAVLLQRMQATLKVVPAVFFDLLDKTVELRKACFLDLPPRLEKAQLREFAHLPQRAELARLSCRMAAYSRHLAAFDSQAVAPQQYSATEAFTLEVTKGVATRIDRMCTQTLAQPHTPPASLLIGPPPDAAGILTGFLEGHKALSKGPTHRREFGHQMVALSAELSLLQSSLRVAQDFVQLPTIQMWHQQFRSVVKRALQQDLNLLSLSVPPLISTSPVLYPAATGLARKSAAFSHAQPQLSQARQQRSPCRASGSADVLTNQLAQASSLMLPHQAIRGAEQLLPDQDQASASHQEHHAPALSTAAALPDTAISGLSPEQASYHQQQQEQLAQAQQGMPDLPEQAQQGMSGLPEEAQQGVLGLPEEAGQEPALISLQSQSGRSSAGQARLRTPSRQATARPLPKQATLSQRSFLSDCLSGVLRLSDPYVTQYQPLLCGWYDAEGGEIIGLGSVSSIRTALGVPGLSCLIRLLQVRLEHGLMQLSTLLKGASTGLDMSSLQPPGTGLPLQPPAFKEALAQGSKLWPQLAHYLAGLGQTQLLMHRFQSEVRLALRLLTPGRETSSFDHTGSAPVDAQHVHQEQAPALCDVKADSTAEQPQGFLPRTASLAGPSAAAMHRSESQRPALSAEATQHAEAEQALLGAQGRHAQAQLAGASSSAKAAVPHGMQMLLDAQPPAPPSAPLRAPAAGHATQPGVLMLLCILDLMPRCEMDFRLGTLHRRAGSSGSPDLQAVVHGCAMWLQHQNASQFEALLQTASQYINAFTQVATSATAQGMQAAGIQVGLPMDIGNLLAFLQQLAKAEGNQVSMLRRHLPSFLLDNWQTLI